MKRGRPLKKPLAAVEEGKLISEENQPTDAKKIKTEVADSGRESVENDKPDVKNEPAENEKPDVKNELADNAAVANAQDAPRLSRAELRAAKIGKLKELLRCIQQYAQFTSSQLAGKRKFDADLAAKAKSSKASSQPAELFGGQLRDYQVEGVRWMQMLHDLAVNGILADEMGLGKTVMVIATIAKIVQSGAPGPFLVIAPLSTLPNWVNEVKRFVPDIPLVLFHGDAKKRKLLRSEVTATINLHKKYAPGASIVRPIVITSYEMVIADTTFLSNVDWRMLIVDEAQRLKNENCVLRDKLRRFTTPRRLILTGTPIQNSLTELWSLLSFLMPDIFKTRLSSFESLLDEILSDDASLWITDEDDAKQKEEIVSLLHEILRPFILRRLKADVDLKIPPKKELVLRCALTPKQAEMYGKLIDIFVEQAARSDKGLLADSEFADSATRERNQTQFFGVNDEDEYYNLRENGGWIVREKPPKPEEPPKQTLAETLDAVEIYEEDNETEAEQSVDYWLEECTQLSLRNLMMQLRKCVNHPYLFRNSYIINENFIQVSCKLRLLDAMMKELLKDPKKGHKAIVYSQFVMNLEILAQFCDFRGWKYVRIDGGTNLESRSESIRKFNTDPNTVVFLVSTRAGGLGINLTAADTVFLYDSDWNPQMDLQARDRCHRIGQTRPVVIYRFIVSNTVDQRMWECATGKRRLERVVLQQSAFMHAANSLLGAAAGDSGSPSKSNDKQKLSFSVDDMIELLKRRDWEEKDDSAFSFEDGKAAVDSRIAELLDRSDLLEEWKIAQKKDAAKEAAMAASKRDTSTK